MVAELNQIEEAIKFQPEEQTSSLKNSLSAAALLLRQVTPGFDETT